MNCSAEYLNYESTGYFSKIVIDYLNRDEKLKPFFETPVSIHQIESVIEKRKLLSTNRSKLVEVLQKQYSSIHNSGKTLESINLLNHENTFTITTAHQPNIFTGHLYFIYKIVHTIKLAHELNKVFNKYHFVPVFYMGSEDADLDELGQIHINNEKITWQTNQTGAVGRMRVDDALLQIIENINGQLSVLPFGKNIIEVLKSCYTKNTSIEQATFSLLHHLFGDDGLVVLLPDNTELKRFFVPIVEKELKEQFSFPLVKRTSEAIANHYRVQASGRNVNLFYLINDKRERIEKDKNKYVVRALKKEFTQDEIISELYSNPERFSPNVILRGVFQEMILPNIIFIGGGGELAYWLELKSVFENCAVPYPMLVLRNSFLLIEKKERKLIEKFGWKTDSVFLPEKILIEQEVKKNSTHELSVEEESNALKRIYDNLKLKSGFIDNSLVRHVEALHKKSDNKLKALEKKLYKAEKRNQETLVRQIEKLKQKLFPGGLQERVENFLPYYSKYGNDFLSQLYNYSPTMEQQFTILQIDE